MRKLLILWLISAAFFAVAQEEGEKEPREINWGLSSAALWTASGYNIALNAELYLGRRHLLYAGPKAQLSRLSRYSGKNKIGINAGYAFRLMTRRPWSFYLNPDAQWISIPSYRNNKSSHRWELIFGYMPTYYFNDNFWTGLTFGYGVFWKNVYAEENERRKNHVGYAGLIRLSFSFRFR